jgi:hypothetical protein
MLLISKNYGAPNKLCVYLFIGYPMEENYVMQQCSFGLLKQNQTKISNEQQLPGQYKKPI